MRPFGPLGTEHDLNLGKHFQASLVARALITLAAGSMLASLVGCAAPTSDLAPSSAPAHAFGP